MDDYIYATKVDMGCGRGALSRSPTDEWPVPIPRSVLGVGYPADRPLKPIRKTEPSTVR
jgi:hypothetical protein